MDYSLMLSILTLIATLAVLYLKRNQIRQSEIHLNDKVCHVGTKAICIFNDYKTLKTDQWGPLNGVADDRICFKTMLKNYEKVEVGANVVNIKEFVHKTIQKWKDEKVSRLHFHYSGHGISNKLVKAVFSGTTEYKCISPDG